ncbi:hypothetical protein SBOR_9479 [Sclerotinia borealis F-4128]|uniref:Zn(2)-C6 fungal-type domain-containing protein n=1 Tax=Sclerotinia borealis (strain F-4128) TaxID=1432307 RepID=W9C2M3_SCLBF|nr:hypothetical protein SBOR_9479 [Sclerotinia borealis F-4128]
MQNNIPPRTTIPHGDSFNPRPTKRGRPDRRSRSTRACDKCKKAKTKCSGDKPCTWCIGLGLEHECTYEAPYSRGLPPKIRLNPAHEHSAQLHQPNYNGFNSINSIDSSSFQKQGSRQLLPKLGANGEVLPDNMAPSRQQLKHYSTASIFQGVQQGFDMPLKGLSVPIFAFGDLPMPTYRSGIIALPNKDVGAKLVATYFDQVSHCMLILHIPTVENWTMDLLSDDGYTLQNNELKSRNAIVLLIFASAQAYLSGPQATNSDPSMRYFQLADEQLQSETGPPQLASVQARLLQCYYLLSRGRINQCWSTFGTVVNLIFVLGIHRKHSQEGIINLVDIECQKRVFWAAFTLDKFLSHALDDRPQLIELDNTDQDMPKLVNDRQLTSTFLMPAGKDTLPMNFATNLQVELAIIISKVLKETCGTHRPDVKIHLEIAHDYMNDLSGWKQKASPLLDANLDFLSQVQKLQRIDLFLAYHHAQVLLLRNFILDNEVANSSNGNSSNQADAVLTPEVDDAAAKAQLVTDVDEVKGILVEACLAICKIMEEQPDYPEFDQSLSFRNDWFTHYVIYSAAAVTYIISHQHPAEAAKSSCMILKKARLLHQPLKSVAQPGSFIAQCVSNLDELKDAVDDVIEQHLGVELNTKIAERNTNITKRSAKIAKRMAKMPKRSAESSGSGSGSGSGSEYVDAEDTPMDFSSDDGGAAANGNENGNGNGARRDDTNMGQQKTNRTGRDASDGRIPIMDRFARWGFSRLTAR